ncbi:T9SS type B sorting domain-containing protein [Flavobacterium sp.]|uniref:T9SS type B sorting domain-containing protein n=1 Tax=Flavobacterium sp. TaxID=239 RepID=UPI003751A76A
MKNFFRSFVFLFLITAFLNTNVLAKSSINGNASMSLVAAPIVTTPVYLCQFSVAVPLTATPSVVGATLKWYTALTGGVALPGAPTPITTTVGTTTYYVTETPLLGVESTPRTPIKVDVVANDNQTISFIDCVYNKTQLNSIYFDWANILNHPANAYNYSYSIQGGPSVLGNANNSSVEIFNVLPGQSVTVTIISVVGFPCVPVNSKTCSLPCVTMTTPTFAIPTTYCINDIVVLPTTSTNSPFITGTWSPFPVDTSTMGTTTYTFTPDPISFPCALTTKLSLSVEPIEPDFTDFSICSGDPVLILSNLSNNGITGTWSPTNTVDTSILGIGTFPFTFIPTLGQPCTPTNKTINVTVNSSNAILNLNWTVTEAFAKNQIVTVTDPVGANYLYQMDSGPFQTSPVFENVASGIRSITVKDINGCSELTDNNVLVIGYPKYFTPNGDNHNEMWNIPTLSDQLNARIYIFDRYGKLLKDISPKDPGWDGTYIGQPMPADDYWFTVEYVEQSIVKKYKSHFSLKR